MIQFVLILGLHYKFNLKRYMESRKRTFMWESINFLWAHSLVTNEGCLINTLQPVPTHVNAEKNIQWVPTYIPAIFIFGSIFIWRANHTCHYDDGIIYKIRPNSVFCFRQIKMKKNRIYHLIVWLYRNYIIH